MKNKRFAAAGIALGLVVGGAAGFALGLPGVSSAQTGTTTPPATTAPSDAQAAHEAKLRETLKPLVDNGTLTQSQLDAVVGALQSAGPILQGHPGGPRFGANLNTAASTIGVTEDELRSALSSGQSIADVAKAHNVDPQTVIDALVTEMKQRLADAVTAGKMTQANADQLAADSTTRITDTVNGVIPPGGLGRGPFGQRPNATPAPSTTTN